MSHPDAFDLDGRAAVVTGAASGIGRAVAVALAAAGARVVLGDVDEAGAKVTAESIAAAGGVALVQRTDVAERAEVDALVARACDEYGRLDVVANVAGILQEAPVAELTETDLDRALAVNLKGVLWGCRAAAAVMVPRGSGSIVNIASSAAFQAHPSLAAYSISKAGVVALTRTLAAEVARHGVRVNAVAPGLVDTPMAAWRARREDGSIDEEERERLLARTLERIPLGVASQPEDVAHAVLYLASDAARTTTGQVLHPNGGRPMV